MKKLIINYDEYINYSIVLNGIEVLIQPKRVSVDDALVAKVSFKYDYDSGSYAGIPSAILEDLTTQPLGVNSLNETTIEYEFGTKFYLRANEEKPIPIYDEEGLFAMQEGASYILMKDLADGPYILENWIALETIIKSLDGNGRTIKINSFDIEMIEDTNIPITKKFWII